MPKSLDTWIKDIREGLEQKGENKNITVDDFKAEFMIQSGYSMKKVNEWYENFKLCKLIKEKGNNIEFL